MIIGLRDNLHGKFNIQIDCFSNDKINDIFVYL